MAKSTNTVPAFTGARTIAAALNKACKADIAAAQKAAVILNQFIDACRVSGVERTPQGAEAVRKAFVAGCQEYILMGGPVKTSFDNYATGVKRAFFHGVEWTPRTFQDPVLAVPSAKTGKTRAGSVSKTNAKELIKTIRRAIEQARLLKQDAVAQGLVDLGFEIDPEFTETAAE